MKYKNKIVFGLLSLIFLSSMITCFKKTDTVVKLTNQPEEKVLVISREVQGSQGFKISIKKNETLVVKIQGNPTTGYGWYLDNHKNLRTDELKPLNLDESGSPDEYKTDPHPPGYVGVGGYYYFRFQPKKPGVTVDLVFIHKRIWSPEENVKRVYVAVDIIG